MLGVLKKGSKRAEELPAHPPTRIGCLDARKGNGWTILLLTANDLLWPVQWTTMALLVFVTMTIALHFCDESKSSHGNKSILGASWQILGISCETIVPHHSKMPPFMKWSFAFKWSLMMTDSVVETCDNGDEACIADISSGLSELKKPGCKCQDDDVDSVQLLDCTDTKSLLHQNPKLLRQIVPNPMALMETFVVIAPPTIAPAQPAVNLFTEKRFG